MIHRRLALALALSLLAMACEGGDEALLREMLVSYITNEIANDPAGAVGNFFTGGKLGNKLAADLADEALQPVVEKLESDAQQKGDDAKKLAREAVTDDDRKKALQAYDDAINTWPKDSKLTAEQAQQLRERAQLRADLGDVQGARDDLDKAVGKNPGDPAIRLQRAEFNKQSDPSKALLDYETAQRQIDKRTDIDDASKGLKVGNIERARAQVLADQGKTKDAIEALNKAEQNYNRAGGPSKPADFYSQRAQLVEKQAGTASLGKESEMLEAYSQAARDYGAASRAKPSDPALAMAEARASLRAAGETEGGAIIGNVNPSVRSNALQTALDAAQRAQRAGTGPDGVYYGASEPVSLEGRTYSQMARDHDVAGRKEDTALLYQRAALAHQQAASLAGVSPTPTRLRADFHEAEALYAHGNVARSQASYQQALATLDRTARNYQVLPPFQQRQLFNLRANVLYGLGRSAEADANVKFVDTLR